MAEKFYAAELRIEGCRRRSFVFPGGRSREAFEVYAERAAAEDAAATWLEWHGGRGDSARVVTLEEVDGEYVEIELPARLKRREK